MPASSTISTGVPSAEISAAVSRSSSGKKIRSSSVWMISVGASIAGRARASASAARTGFPVRAASTKARSTAHLDGGYSVKLKGT